MKAGNIKYAIHVCQAFAGTETFTYVYMRSKYINCTNNIKDVLVMVCSRGACRFFPPYEYVMS